MRITDWGDFPDNFNPDKTGKLALIAAREVPLFVRGLLLLWNEYYFKFRIWS